MDLYMQNICRLPPAGDLLLRLPAADAPGMLHHATVYIYIYIYMYVYIYIYIYIYIYMTTQWRVFPHNRQT